MAVPTARLGNLSNSIHAVFRRSNFALDQDTDYNALTPALRLASRFISQPTPLAIWHTIMSGAIRSEKHVIHPLSADEEYHYEFCDHSPDLTDQQVRDTEAMLIGLAGRVTFKLIEEDVRKSQTWVMITDRLDEDKRRAVVHIPRAAIKAVREAALHFDTTGDDFHYTLLSFQFAKTIVHELAHAAYSASREENKFCYFSGSAICEEGFTWENEIFGGLIEIQTSTDSEDDSREIFHALITRWPNSVRTAACLRDESMNFGIRLRHSWTLLPKIKDTVRGTNRNTRCYIDLNESSFFNNLFKDDFWARIMIEEGPIALQPSEMDEPDEWTSLTVTPGDMQTLAQSYHEAMEVVEPHVRVTCTPEEYAELRRLCGPWDDFVGQNTPALRVSQSGKMWQWQ